jgi:hypothetical protein
LVREASDNIRRSSPYTAGELRNTRDGYVGCKPPRDRRQGRIRCERINGTDTFVVIDVVPVETEPHGVEQARAEDVVFSHGDKLTLGARAQ